MTFRFLEIKKNTAMEPEFIRRRMGPLARFAVAVLSLLLGVIAFATHPTAAHPATTTGGAATYTSDLHATAHRAGQAISSGQASLSLLSDVREGPQKTTWKVIFSKKSTILFPRVTKSSKMERKW